MKKNKEMDIVFLLDRSGSMANNVEDTIGAYNSYLKKQKEKKYNSKITTILFDNEYEILYKRESITDVKELTEKEYYVRGCTALLDAIGKSITDLDKVSKNNKVLFVITTDGLENASKNYTKEQIKELITGHSNWEFLYIGADIDSYSEGTSLGISHNNIANYKKTKEGTRALFNSIDCATNMLYECSNINGNWKSFLNKEE